MTTHNILLMAHGDSKLRLLTIRACKYVRRVTGVALAALLLHLTPAAAQLTTTTTHLDSDAFGNIILATDEQGNVLWRERYQPYGATRINQASKTNPVNLANPQDRGANSIGFHGKEADAATGLSYFGARYYDPVAGRFMGTDAAPFSPANPHSFNRYAYGNGNPYKYKDPDGNMPVLAPLLLAARALWIARGAQVAITGAEIAAGDALGGASLAVGAAAGAKAVGKAIDAAEAAKGADKVVYRLGDSAESASRLGRKSVEAEHAIGHHGVSASTTKPPAGTACSAASCSSLEARGFEVRPTPSRRDPNHQTIVLPKPVTNEVAKDFNQAFGRTRAGASE